MDFFNDDRFVAVAKDPRFRQVPKQERKVKIDKRFQGMFTDKRFKLKYSVDKRGRPENQSTGENLKKFYELEESDDERDNEEDDGYSKRGDNCAVKPSASKTIKSGKKKRRSGRELLLEYRRRKALARDASIKLMETLSSIGKKIPSRLPMTEKRDVCEADSDISDSDDEEEEDESGLGSDDTETIKASPLKTKTKLTLDPSSKSGQLWQRQVGVDLARGEGNIETSSSESDSEDEGQPGGSKDIPADVRVVPLTDELSHKWGELDADAPREEATSRRLAICNMDWDSVTASDLYILLSSFKPTGGLIHSVKIYPSEFGLQRMAEEDAKGPQELVENDENKKSNKQLEKSTKEKYHMEKLRKYQLQRLKYYYAVVDCDSAATANGIYEQCDGMEYETSSSRLDLRFIPDDTVFEQEPKDVSTELPDTATYKPMDFQTTALTSSSVQLTWDETDKRRAKQTAEAFQTKKSVEDLESHMQAYLASSSDEDDEEEGEGVDDEEEEDEASNMEDGGEEDTDVKPKTSKGTKSRIDQYRSLLKGIEENEKQEKEDREMEMEISWEPGLKETTQEIVKKKSEGSGSTPWEKYLDKKKEKKKERKEQIKKTKQVSKVVDEQEEQAFSDDELPEGVDLNDSFFKDSLKEMGRKENRSKRPGKQVEEKTDDELQDEKQRKAALELLMLDDNDDGKQHFNLKSIIDSENMTKSKRKRQMKQQRKMGQSEDALAKPVEDNFEIDTADPRFEAIFTSHEYAIDPSNPQFKKTKAMSTLIKEKQKRRQDSEENEDGSIRIKKKQKKKTNGPSSTTELSQLVRSIKSKTEQYHSRKKLKVES